MENKRSDLFAKIDEVLEPVKSNADLGIEEESVIIVQMLEKFKERVKTCLESELDLLEKELNGECKKILEKSPLYSSALEINNNFYLFFDDLDVFDLDNFYSLIMEPESFVLFE